MYGKIFASLWDGTIATRWPVWSTFVFMIANCGPDGVLDMTQEAIAARTGIPLEEVKGAITALEAPDPRSRTRDHEGRRIELLDTERDWGWRILNYALYRSLVDLETRRAQERTRQAKHRDKSRSVTPGHAPSRQEEAEGEAEAENLSSASRSHVNGAAVDEDNRVESPAEWIKGFDEFWSDYPRKVAKEAARRAYAKLDRTQKTYDALFAGLRWYASNVWPKRESDKIEHAATWLNQRRYLDASEAQ